MSDRTPDERTYDDEVYQRAVRILGSLDAIQRLCEAASCMPSDVATARLIGSLRFMAQQAVLSAWEYAGQYAPPKEES